MAQSAIGLIETKGLVGVIEAADTAAKAADVRLLGIERIGGGLVSLRFSGDVASVHAAVQAASEAARQVSEVISAHVIAQPHLDVEALSLASAPGDSRGAAVDGGRVRRSSPSDADVLPSPSDAELGSLSVTKLRHLARRTPGVSLKGRQISRANKQVLIAALRSALQGSG